MRIIISFINLTAVIALIYLLFEIVPSLLLEKNTAYVIGGVIFIISVISVIIPHIIDIYFKVKGNKY